MDPLESTTRSATQTATTGAAPPPATDVDSSRPAPAPSTHFTTSGPKPAALGGFNETPAASASDQAFGAPAQEPHWMKVARKYNEEHPEHVAQFNSLTHDEFVSDGVLDLASVVAYQQRHGLRGDGMIGPHTVNTAHKVSRTAQPGAQAAPAAQEVAAQHPHPSAEGSAMASEMFREVNGGPGEKSPTTPSGAPVGKPAAEVATSPTATVPTPTTPAQPPQSAAPAAPSAAVGHPSAEGSAMASEMFREVNGGPGQASPTTPSGAEKPPVDVTNAPAPHQPPANVPQVAEAPEQPAAKAAPAAAPEQPAAKAAPEQPAPAAPAAHPAEHASAQAAPHAPEAAHAETAAPAAANGVQGWDSPDANGQFTGAHELHIEQVSRAQVYKAITDVAPNLPHEFKVMMVGHSWIEQHGKAINNNYMGVEFANPNKPGNQAYTYVRTSTMVSRKEYDANPAKYEDWKVGSKDRNTIQQQLDRNEPLIYCTEMRNRPAYQSLDAASMAFVHSVQWRLNACQNSAKPEHQKLAADALAGDEKAYAEMMTLRDKSIGLSPYNTDKGYPARMIEGINEARADSTITSLQ